MAIDQSEYLSTLIQQIGYEKSAFDKMLNLSLTISLGAVGLSLKFILDTKYETALVISGLTLAIVLALFFRAIRAYRNYYSYMRLKNKLVESEILPNLSQEIKEMVETIDLRRSWEGNRIKDFTHFKLCFHVLLHTEFILLFIGLFFLELFSFYKSGMIVTVWSGYVVLAQIGVIALVIRGIFPKA
jgi:hypothetical protein